ncbi:hypothetical protein AB835_00305 [Candidatus Endobugula sertula]|uniref:Periplasmic chaperone PpiD n=1 Tax=Candidatus Endobugula sertula TaxID=62101 RepID=A0A1D2QTX0_9GAMM|nr:hypothetical protein AB835_00305 [Candidatus Endobugula sertula]
MLQTMRNKIKGLVAIFLIGLLVIPLALLGIENLFYKNPYAPDDVAEVNGQKITEREVQLALQSERQRLQTQFGTNVPTQLLSDESLRGPVLDRLIHRALIADVAEKGNMTLLDKEIDEIIVKLPDFQVEGKFDSDRFVNLIRSIGYSPATFRAMMRKDMVVNQMKNALLMTDFVTDQEIERAVVLSRQTRDFEWITLALGDLPESMLVSDDEVNEYYESNKQDYLSEEQVAIEYLELRVDQLEKDVTVSDDEVRAQYEQELDSLSKPTEREVAHIMIEGNDDAAQAKMLEVQEKLAAGEDFATLAAKYSDDFGSRDNGGHLGVSTGDVFPAEFEQALLDLKEGDVSEPIVVDDATHFIKLLTLNAYETPSFEKERLRITAELKRIKAEEKFVSDIEILKDLAYNAENLEEVGIELNLPVNKTALFSRSGAKDVILQDSRVLEAAFSDRVVKDGFSSEVLELSTDNSAMVIKMIEHKPVRTLTLEEKKKDITGELKLEKAKARLTEQAVSIRESLDNGTSLSALSEEKGLSLSTQVAAKRHAAGVPQELLNHLFAMPHPDDDQGRIDELSLDNGDYVIVNLTKVTSGDIENLTDDERKSLKTNLASSLAGDEYQAWQSMLREEANVEVYNTETSAL